MILLGKNLTQLNDPMQESTIENLYDEIKNPQPDFERRLKQLRLVYTINPKQYSQLKRDLPYFVCGCFNPPIRRRENFAYMDCFVVDIDKLISKGLEVNVVREKIQNDSRVVLCFKSPSEDGLKLLFRLKDKCYDSGIYSVFYKAFIKDFSLKYNLEQAIDSVTCDVSRACFLSVDKDVYYNLSAESVDVNAYVSTDNVLEFMDLKRGQEHEIKEIEKQKEVAKSSCDPTSDVIAQIRARLNPKAKIDKTNVYVPEILENIIDELKNSIESFGITVTGVKDISYGKQISGMLGVKKAEMNLFYGKHGFKYICSVKSGTDQELNTLLVDIVKEYIGNL